MARNILASLLRRKAPDCAHDDGHQLKAVLGPFDLILMGIGAIIGTGIFVLTGTAAALQAGPAITIAFAVSGIACVFAALSYSELAASVRGCGSAYGYAYAAFGEVIAWLIGWILILEYGIGVAAVANGWSGYLIDGLKAMNINFPEALTKGPFALDSQGLKAGGIVNLPAVIIILILMFLLIVGVKESARLNAGMVFIKVLTIVVFVAVASANINPDLWTPFSPFGWYSASQIEHGHPTGILAAAAAIFFAYVGFDAVSTAVEETKNPQKDIPIGIIGSLVFCTLIYIIVSGLLTAIVPYTELNVASPVAHALGILGIKWASGLVATGVVAGLTTVMLVLYYALTRIILAMGRDGLLPDFFSSVSSKTHTPVKTTVVCGLIIAAFAGFVPLKKLADIVSIGTLTAFVIVCAGVVVMRRVYPDLPRPFKIRGGVIIPVLGIISCGGLVFFLSADTHLNFLLWLALGMVIYIAYSFRHSRLR